jgi:hypothetical protein
MLAIHKDHILRIEMSNSPKGSIERENLEQIVLGDSRDVRLLPPHLKAILWQQASAVVLQELRDEHPCPAHDDDVQECTCNPFDRAIDILMGDTHNLWVLFEDSEWAEEFSEQLRLIADGMV